MSFVQKAGKKLFPFFRDVSSLSVCRGVWFGLIFKNLIVIEYTCVKGSPGGSAAKNLPAMQEPQETWVRSLGREDPLEKGVATHSSVPAWRIPCRKEPGGLQSMELRRVVHD